MTIANINAVDWNAMWDHQMKLSLLKWDDPHFRYERTQLPPIGIKTSDYVEKLLARMELLPEYSVLDVGCGNGAISIPLAKKVRYVTAMDSEPGLLFVLTQKAMKDGVSNLKFAHQEWLKAQIGIDINTHDIVLASRLRQMCPLQKFLDQMHQAARHICYLTWIVSRKEFDPQICAILEKDYYPLPEYGIIYNMLYSMGIHPNVDIFTSTENHRFENEESAIEEATRGYQVESDAAREKIRALVKSELRFEDGFFYHDSYTTWALIWWCKGQ